MINTIETLVHITQIAPGDTVRHNGELKTVTRQSITRSNCMGLTLFGDSYHLGRKKVTKVTFK